MFSCSHLPNACWEPVGEPIPYVGGVKQLLEEGPFTVEINRGLDFSDVKLYKSDSMIVVLNRRVYRISGEKASAFVATLVEYGYYYPRLFMRERQHELLRELPFYERYYNVDQGRQCIPILSLEGKYASNILYHTNPRRHYPQLPKSIKTGLEIIQGYTDVFVEKRANIDREFVDAEYNQEIIIEEPLTEDTIVPEVYERFERYVKIVRDYGDDWTKSLSGQPTYKMQGLKFTAIQEVMDAWQGNIRLPWYDIDGVNCWGVKCGAFKKDGTRRKVFPMSPRLNAYITQVYCKSSYSLPENIREVKRPSDFKPFAYSYDVKNCDRVMWPYFKRLIGHDPNFIAFLRYNGENYQLPQFPSGCCVFMRFITTAFTVALCDLGNTGCEVQIQGDGFAMCRPLGDEFLKYVREFPKNEINGFRIIQGKEFEYVRGDEKLSTPIIKTRGLCGVKKWQFRKEIYERLLNANITLKNRDESLALRFKKMETSELLWIANYRDGEMRDLVTRISGWGQGGNCSWRGATIRRCMWL